VIAYGLGLLIGLFPIIYFFCTNPSLFLFNNLIYHQLRSISPPFFEKLSYVTEFIIVLVINSPFLLLFGILGIFGGFSKNTLGKDKSFLFLTIVNTIGFSLTSLVPFPVYFQYFTATLGPFLIPIAAEGIRIINNKNIIINIFIVLFSFSLFFLEIIPESSRHSRDPNWSLKQYSEVSKRIIEISHDGDIVLSFWPGYVFESGTNYFPGMENHFGLQISPKLTADEHQKYKIASTHEIISAVKNKIPDVIIIGVWMSDFYKNFNAREEQIFVKSLSLNYKLKYNIDGVKIYYVENANEFP
jgi:hypothetical protein